MSSRREFIKKLGIGVVSTIVPVSVISSLFDSAPPVEIEDNKYLEGLWHQIRKAKVHKYNSSEGITREHIKQAVSYIDFT